MGRDSVTETIQPIVTTNTLKVFAVEEAKVKRDGVKAHSMHWQQCIAKNSYPVQPPTTFILMYYVYLLKSEKDNKFYIGFTADLRKRLQEHNERKNKSTSYRGPFKLIYYESYLESRDARIREQRLKQFKNGYRELMKRIKYSTKYKSGGGARAA